jgi:hypothetical protein
MSNGHGPKSSISNLRPMNGSMDEHATGRSSDGPNGTFSNCILVVSRGAGKLGKLPKLIEILGKCLGGKCRAIVRHIGKGDHTNITTHGLKRSLGF